MTDDPRIENMRRDVATKLKKWDRPVFGYTPEPEQERKEGDVWEDQYGKKWTVKDGLRQSISKLQSARTPWFCPKCSKSMSHRFDDKFYTLYGQCYDCTVKEHTKMRIDGTWEAYEKKQLRNNERAFLKDKIDEYKDYIRTFKVPQVHYQDGRWETIAKLEHFKGMFEQIRTDIKLCEDRIAQLDAEEKAEREKNDDQS